MADTVTHFSLLPCVKCQAPAGWHITGDDTVGRKIHCCLCGHEKTAPTLLDLVEQWNKEFAVALQQAMQQAAAAQGRPGPGGRIVPVPPGSKIVPPRG